jgi:hypothetical protein
VIHEHRQFGKHLFEQLGQLRVELEPHRVDRRLQLARRQKGRQRRI